MSRATPASQPPPTQPIPSTQAPDSPGARAVALLRYRNLSWTGMAKTLALVTPSYLSASTYAMITSNRTLLTPACCPASPPSCGNCAASQPPRSNTSPRRPVRCAGVESPRGRHLGGRKGDGARGGGRTDCPQGHGGPSLREVSRPVLVAGVGIRPGRRGTRERRTSA